MAAPDDHRSGVPTVGLIHFVQAGPSGPSATVLRVHDGGTGLLGPLRRALDVDDVTAPVEVELAVEIRPTEDPSIVEVRGPWRPSPNRWRRQEVADRILAQVTRRHLDQDRGDANLHAGGVADHLGRVALLVGSSGAGKSTLVTHLVSRGLDLLTDEQVALRPAAGHVAAFTRPIAVKPGGEAMLPAAAARWLAREPVAAGLVPVRALAGAHRLHGRPALVVLLDRRPPGGDRRDPDRVVAEPLAADEAVFSLLGHSLDLVRDPAAGLGALAWLATSAPVVRLTYDRSAAAADWVEAALAASPTSSARPTAAVRSWHVVEPEPKVGPTRTRPTEAAAAARSVVALVLADGAVLYRATDRVALHLDRRGADLWEQLPLAALPEAEDHLVLLRSLVAHGFAVAADCSVERAPR